MLGKHGILRELDKGNLVISNFNEKQVGPNSYDVRLGHWFIRVKNVDTTNIIKLNSDSGLTPLNSIFDAPIYKGDGEVFCINPNEYILAHTNEIVGFKNNY